jgi:hypothetical protein
VHTGVQGKARAIASCTWCKGAGLATQLQLLRALTSSIQVGLQALLACLSQQHTGRPGHTHPGGSTLQMHSSRRSMRPGSAMSWALTAQGSGGTHACTAGVKGLVLMSFSISSTAVYRRQQHQAVCQQQCVSMRLAAARLPAGS